MNMTIKIISVTHTLLLLFIEQVNAYLIAKALYKLEEESVEGNTN